MALDFDGVDDTITCGNAAPINDLAAFTYCAWIRPDTVGEGSVGRVVDKFEKMIYLAATNAVGTYVNRATTASEIQSANNTITMGAWNFVACTFDGTTLRLFHGVPGGVASDLGLTDGGSGAAVADNTRVFTIGNNSGGTGATFDGRIAYPRVFNAALSAAELTAVMYNRPARPSAQVGFWPLIGASPEPDWSGNAANGTVTGAVVADGPPVPPPYLGDEEYLTSVAGADTTLSGTGQAAVSVAAGLQTSITPAAAVSAAATTQASLNTSITLAAAVTASVAASASAQTAIEASAAAIGAAGASGALSTAIQPAATAQSTAQTAAALDTQITLAAAVGVAASAAGSLDGAATLAAAVTGSALGAGALDTSIQAAGTVQVTAASTASLATAITLAGAAPATAQAQASFERLLAPSAQHTKAVVIPWRSRARVVSHRHHMRVVSHQNHARVVNG